MEKVPMTAEGHSAMMEEIKHLKSVERPRIIRAIEEARSHGDLSENAEYHAAKEQQGWTEARVAELEDKISRAEVIDISKLSGATVTFGARVTLVDEETDAKISYQIVGDFEADVKWQDLRLLAHRPRRHRQEGGRLRRSGNTGRRQELRNSESEVELSAPGLLVLRFSNSGRVSSLARPHNRPPGGEARALPGASGADPVRDQR